MGLIPVVGGITGGVISDKISGDSSKEKNKNKLKEGFYQFFANIFLCNIGAGGALYAIEKTPFKNSRAARITGMPGGITSVGILGGNAIANFMVQNLFNPLCDKGVKATIKDMKTKKFSDMFKNLNSERHPEPLDIGLHVDDIATVGVMSGLKWIEPILPMLYTISGYRAGIGYRNGNMEPKTSP